MSNHPAPGHAGKQRKLLASLPTKLRIAAACTIVLITGASLRPRTAAPLAPPDERPAPLLEERVQRAVPDFRGIAEAVARLPARGVMVQRDASDPAIASDFGSPAPMPSPVFAVAASDSYLVTHVAALTHGRPPTLTSADGAQIPTAVAAFDVATDLVLLRSPSPAVAISPFADTVPRPGSLVIGAARSNTTDVAIPLFITKVGADAYGIGGDANSAPPGLPIYDLDGGLLAVSAGDGTAWRIRYALDRLLTQVATGAMPSAIGVTYQVIDEALASAFGTNGLAIVDVAAGGPADNAGLEIGDVITAVNPESTAHVDLTSALASLRAGDAVPLSLWRAGKASTLTVTPAFAHEMVSMESDAAPTTGPLARTVFQREALAAASVPVDATVVMINGRRIESTAQAERELRRVNDRALVLAEHRGRRFFALVEMKR